MDDFRQKERRMTWWKRLWYDYCDDFGELVTIIIGVILCLAVCILVWLGIIGVEGYLR